MDLPCHGESAYLPSAAGTRDVMGAGREVLALLAQLKLFPNIIIGHSFGGKVVLSMVHEYCSLLPRPVKVRVGWVGLRWAAGCPCPCSSALGSAWGCTAL